MATTARKLTDVLPLATTSPRQIPQIGLGTYLSPPERTLNSCLAALKAGYRQVDTGQYYENEGEVGQAIQQCPADAANVVAADESYAAR
jgi:diketogulonate reductase-like aldo/keto reductase